MTSLVLLGVLGCSQLDEIRNTVEGLTNPLVVEGMYLGVAEPDSETIDLSKTHFDKGAAVTAFLADAGSVDDMEDAPVPGASVVFDSPSNGALTLADGGTGQYTLTGEDGLSYRASEFATLNASIDGEVHSAGVDVPVAAEAEIDAMHSAGVPMIVNLEGQGYDSVLVVVFDAGSGEVTFSNEPESIKEVYEFAHPGDDAVEKVEVPSTAFPAQSLYAVGVAGLLSSQTEDLDSVNTAISAVMAGQMKFYPVSTIEQ